MRRHCCRHEEVAIRDTIEQVGVWRARAKQLRAVAEDFQTDSSRGSVLNIAMTYERMAEELESRLAQLAKVASRGKIKDDGERV